MEFILGVTEQELLDFGIQPKTLSNYKLHFNTHLSQSVAILEATARVGVACRAIKHPWVHYTMPHSWAEPGFYRYVASVDFIDGVRIPAFGKNTVPFPIFDEKLKSLISVRASAMYQEAYLLRDWFQANGMALEFMKYGVYWRPI